MRTLAHFLIGTLKKCVFLQFKGFMKNAPLEKSGSKYADGRTGRNQLILREIIKKQAIADFKAAMQTETTVEKELEELLGTIDN